MRQPPKPGWIAWLTLFGAVVGSMVLAVWVNTSSDRKWCSVVETLDDGWQSAPPQTPAGRKLAADFSELRRTLGCSGN